MDPFLNREPTEGLKDRIERILANQTRIGRDPVLDFMLRPLSSRIATKPRKPNLIIVEIESLEREVLGAYNPEYPKMTPFLSKFVHRGTFFPNVVSQPYTTWSVASMFTVQCNLPLLITRFKRGVQGTFHLQKGLNCIGDFLSAAGYELKSYLTNVFVGQFKDCLQGHRYTVADRRTHNMTRDWDMFEHIATVVFPQLKTPFVLHLANADCHWFPRYIVDARCAERMPSTNPIIVRSYDCVDQILEKFFARFEASPLFETTDVILYGDHVIMEAGRKTITLHEPRALVLCFPYHERRNVTKQVTLYDLAPTIMDLLGIEYSPPFPFGENLFSRIIGKPPTAADFQVLYEIANARLRWGNSTVTCMGKTGYCTETRN
jgi:membrane-anchored protein YejM (alkaline phosphatase superfamily)